MDLLAYDPLPSLAYLFQDIRPMRRVHFDRVQEVEGWLALFGCQAKILGR